MTEGSLKNLNILVVDDEPSTVVSVAVVLKARGHVVDGVADGEDALIRLKNDLHRYQIIITDHSMEKVSGLELLTALRATAFRGKVMVLSAHLTYDLKLSYHSLGVDRLISKPFDLAELREAVEELGTAWAKQGL
jgi:DNA-binding response OmpR family regulator